MSKILSKKQLKQLKWLHSRPKTKKQLDSFKRAREVSWKLQRTEKQLAAILRNGKIGLKVAHSLPRTECQMENFMMARKIGMKLPKSKKHIAAVKELSKLPRTKKQIEAGRRVGKLPKTEKQIQTSILNGKRNGVMNGIIVGSKRGCESNAWRGGKSFEVYPAVWTSELKENIRKRNRYLCQICFISEKRYRKKLDIHHIDYNKNNCLQSNLITLCRKCHMKTNYNRRYWKQYFKNKVAQVDLFRIY